MQLVLITLYCTLESETLSKQREFDLSCDNCEYYAPLCFGFPFLAPFIRFVFIFPLCWFACQNLKKKICENYTCICVH